MAAVAVHRREVDGLRAIAVLAVIFFHAGLPAFRGGYVGVDVFFVISGFLITSLVLAEHEAGTLSILRFYERRVRRILPALFLVVAATLPFAWFWMMPDRLKEYAQSVTAVALFGSNISFSQHLGYFDTKAEFVPLLHTWSLAVEEQYYLAAPLILTFAGRLGRRAVLGLLLVIGAASLLWAQHHAEGSSSPDFYLVQSRAWELALGGAAGCVNTSGLAARLTRMTREIVSLLGIGLILLAVFWFDGRTQVPGLPALIPTLGAAMVLLACTPDTLAGRWLGHRSVVGVGLVSYSAYLWHQPLFAFARIRSLSPPSEPVMLLLSFAAVALGALSWRLVEQPFRRGTAFSRRGVFGMALAGSALMAALGVAGVETDGFASSFERRLAAQDVTSWKLMREHTGGSVGRFLEDMVDDGECHFWSRHVDARFEARFATCQVRHSRALIVLGDSHAMNVYNIVAKAALAPFTVAIVSPGCRLSDPDPDCPYEALEGFLEHHRRAVDSVVFTQSGAFLLRDSEGNRGSSKVFEPSAALVVDQEGIARISRYLDRLADKADVVWLGPFAEARVELDVPWRFRGGFFISDKSLNQFQGLEQALQRNATSSHGRFRYRSLHDLLKMDRTFLRVGDCITFRDRDHFSRCGEDIVATRLRSAVDGGFLH